MANADYRLMEKIGRMEKNVEHLTFDGGGGGGDDGYMDERLRKLETSVAVIEGKLPSLATNDGVDSRVSKAETKIIMWVVGAVVLTGIGGKFLGSGSTAPTSAAPPIILQIPTQATQPVQPSAPTPALAASAPATQSH